MRASLGLSFGLFASLLFGVSEAQIFSSALETALSTEPIYLGAKSNVNAVLARKEQAFGALLPQINANASNNANKRAYETRDSIIPVANDRYNSRSRQITLTQPILRYSNFVNFSQTKASLSQAEYQLLNAEQDLFVRLATAWLDLMFARDSVKLTQAQLRTTERQLALVTQGFKLGTHSASEFEEAEAKTELAHTELSSAEADLAIKQALLEQIIGQDKNIHAPYLKKIPSEFTLNENDLTKWLNEFTSNNPNIKAAEWGLEAANTEISKQQAGHLPTLDLVGSYGRNSQSAGNFPGQNGYDIALNSVGVQLTIPLYSGGTQSAKVDEAIALKEKAQLDLESTKRNVWLTTKQAWFGWKVAHSKTKSTLQSFKAMQRAMHAMMAELAQGTKSEIDLLQAQQQVSLSERDLYKSYYDQIINFIKIKASIGRLSEQDAHLLDEILSFVETEGLVHAVLMQNQP